MEQTWQIALENLFTFPLTPAQLVQRDFYWKEEDVGQHNADQNMALRLRSYESDGHGYRQEATLASGNAGQLIRGNDNLSDLTVSLFYGDVILGVANSTYHVKTPTILWNYTPQNTVFNPTFNFPPGLNTVQDAFAFAQGAIPGGEDISAIQGAISPFGDGFAKFDSPFDAFCSLTAQKVPLWNAAAIAFMQALFLGGDTLWVCDVPGAPLVPTPELLALIPLIQQNYDTVWQASVEGTVLADELKSFLASAVPGLNLAL